MAETVPTSSLPPDDDQSSQRSLDSLRQRLIRARADRGACPPLSDLQLDDMPSTEERPGREERLQHLERCDVCQSNLLEWRASWEGRAAQLVAWAKIGGRRIGDATEQVARNASKVARTPLTPDTPPAPVPGPMAETPEVTSYPAMMPKVTPAASPAPPQAPAPPPIPFPSATPPKRVRRERHERRSSDPLPPLVVLEAPLAGVIPSALLHAAAERGAAVVEVENAEEALRDPDFGSVRAIVLTRSRPLADWEKALTSIRERAPGRIVLAIVAAPRLGPAAVTWRRDPGILNPPVGDGDWAAAFSRMGWQPAS